MHRSSESVAAIATALAKAQPELSNPEKAMVGTVYNNRSDSPQSFRYASLSCGLDIVRKTLGGHQIAIAQTTDIDRANGMVNLTTVLLHTSGEWISSDWPVCQLSETSAPRRMGAALTYARLRRQASLIIPYQLRHIFKPTLPPPKSRKASSRSASRVGIAIKAISSSLHLSRVWFAGEGPLTPIILGSPNFAQWGARSAMSSRSRSAGPITGIITASATRPPGGVDRPSIPSGLRGSSGFQRVVSNEGDGSARWRLARPRTVAMLNSFFEGALTSISLQTWR